MPKVTVAQLSARLDALEADYQESKRIVLTFLANATPPLPPHPAPVSDDPNDPAHFVPPPLDPNDSASVRAFISLGQWVSSHHRSQPEDFAYWVGLAPILIARGLEINHKNAGSDAGRQYFWDRLIGFRATGDDAALYGPFRKGL